MSELNDIKVPSAGEPEWRGEITDGKLDQILGGLLIPNQGFSKAMAREIKELRVREAAHKAELKHLRGLLTINENLAAENAPLRAENERLRNTTTVNFYASTRMLALNTMLRKAKEDAAESDAKIRDILCVLLSNLPYSQVEAIRTKCEEATRTRLQAERGKDGVKDGD